MPFGNASFDVAPDRIGLLSIEQILTDYEVLIESVRNEFGWGSPVVTFGGSLAGSEASHDSSQLDRARARARPSHL
eukprot:6702799-Prymnesium_polylepis.2